MLRIAFHKPVESSQETKQISFLGKIVPLILKTCRSKLEKPRRPWCSNTWATVSRPGI